MTPTASRIQTLAGVLEAECRRGGLELAPGQAAVLLRHQARVVAAALHISESWALRSYLDEEAVRGLAVNLVREARASRPLREIVQETLTMAGQRARDFRYARESPWAAQPEAVPDLDAALVADLRALASVTARQLSWDLYLDTVRFGDRPYAYYADQRDCVLYRLPRVCDGMDAAWRLRFAGVLAEVAHKLATDDLLAPTCHATAVALALAVTAVPELLPDLEDPHRAAAAGLGQGRTARTADLQMGGAAQAISWHAPALIAYDPELTYSLEPSSTDERPQDLRPEAWFTPLDGTEPGVWTPPSWVAAASAAGLPRVEQAPPFGSTPAEQKALHELVRGVLEREMSWRRHGDSSGEPDGVPDAAGTEEEPPEPVEAMLLLRPQQLPYMTRKKARAEQQALVVEREGRLVESAAYRGQLAYDPQDDRDFLDPLLSVADQDAALLWAISLNLEEFSAAAAVLERPPDQGLGRAYSGSNGSWQFPSSARLAEQIAGAVFAPSAEGVIVLAPDGHGDAAHPGLAWALCVTRSGYLSCTACRPEDAGASHHDLINSVTQTLR